MQMWLPFAANRHQHLRNTAAHAQQRWRTTMTLDKTVLICTTSLRLQNNCPHYNPFRVVLLVLHME